MKIFSVFLIGILGAFPAFASDHIDGPVTTANRVADLTDLYAFPTPKQPGFLTLILDAYPLVSSTGHFTDKVNYSFIIRRADIKTTDGKKTFETSDEVTINCTFKTPEVTANHVVKCKSSNGLNAESRYEVVQQKAPGDDFRLYSGMRSDPFFFDANFAKTLANDGKISNPGSDTMSGINVLTIVLEIEVSKLYKQNPPSLIAIAAETTTQDSPGVPLRRLDRVGRPEITNVSMVAHKGEPDLRDQYNLDRPFQVPAANQQAYKKRLASNIAFYDAVDGHVDWPSADREHLAELLVNDFLVVDISKPCATAAFFSIEKAMLQNRAYDTCGGRKPNDDIMDSLFTLYISGLNGKPVSDGVDHPSKLVSEQFPYLADPELGFLSRAKAFIAKKILGIPDLP